MKNEEIKTKPKLASLLEELLLNDEVEFEFDFPKNLLNTMAFVRIIIPPLILKGFRIMRSDYLNRKGDHINVVPPFIKGRGRGDLYQTFYIEDKDLWYKLEDKIIEKYHQVKKEVYSDKETQ